MEHRCEAWTALGISCPEGLVRLGKKRDEEEEPEEIFHDRALRPVIIGKRSETQEERDAIVRAVLLESFRRAYEDAGKRAVGIPAEEERVHVPVPKERGIPAGAGIPIPGEMLTEAVRQGARGKELSLWIAAAATSSAFALAFGCGVARGIPGLIKMVQGSGIRTGSAGVGFYLNDAARIKALTQGGVRRLIDSERIGAGGFFPGTEG